MNNNKKNSALDTLRYSAAHLLAQALHELFPHTKLTIGLTTDHGFFYDVLPEKNFKQDDLARIEERMHEISKRNLVITREQVTKEQARTMFADNEFKLELIDAIAEETVGIFWQGDFFDLYRGGHVATTGHVRHFKLTGISGSYWRGKRTETPLQRIRGIAFQTGKELRTYLARSEQAKKYDHRVLGKELDLFSFHDSAPGMPFFHHKGREVYQQLISYLQDLQKETFQEIKTPLIMDESLWRTSGHYDNFKENMYFTRIDTHTQCIRPMNCPSAIIVYKQKRHSYRELPLRMAEFGQVHRYELSGVLHGLFRVRTFTTDDAHIFCTLDQVTSEVEQVIALAQKVYKRFGFTSIRMALATKPEKALGTDQEWHQATEALTAALERQGLPYTINEGEGAFYGPKIEMTMQDAMEREWQCGTVQVDFFLPQNFGLTYNAHDQSRHTPVIIHRAIYGSIERFFGILLEHTKGHFPFWLAPIQVRILSISNKHHTYAETIKRRLQGIKLRIQVDRSGDQISAQIKRAQQDKIPWMIVIGDKERENDTVTLRYVTGKQKSGMSLNDLCNHAVEKLKD